MVSVQPAPVQAEDEQNIGTGLRLVLTHLGALYGTVVVDEESESDVQENGELTGTVLDDLGVLYQLEEAVAKTVVDDRPLPAADTMTLIRGLGPRLERIQQRLNEWTPKVRGLRILHAIESVLQDVLPLLREPGVTAGIDLDSIEANGKRRKGILAARIVKVHQWNKTLRDGYARPTDL